MRTDVGALLLEGEDAQFVLETIFPLLDGTRTECELVAALPGIAADDVSGLLQALRQHGVLLDDPQRDGLAAGVAPDAAERRARLQGAKVVITGSAPWVPRSAEAIHAAGVGQVAGYLTKASACDLAIGVFCANDMDGARDFARTAFNLRTRSITCVVTRAEILLGPLAIPFQTACWNCAHLRMQANAASNNPPDSSEDIGAEASAVILSLLTREVCEAICLEETGTKLVNKVLVFDLLSMQASLHQVLGVPDCDVCGGPPHALRPQDSADVYASGNAAVDLALRMFGWFVNCRTGIVHRVIVETPSALGLSFPIVATAIPANAPVNAARLKPMPVGWGKGMTAPEAVIGALGEAIERYGGSMPAPRRIILSRLADLSGEVLDPGKLALYDDDQYARSDFPFVRFNPDIAHPWILGEWVGARGPVWIPAMLAYLSLDVRKEHVFCQGTSNGLAAGSSLGEAAMRAILELLERDAFMTSWLCKQPGRLVRLDQGLDEDLKAVVSGITALGAKVELVLIEAICEYPTVICLGFGDGVSWPGVTLGLGTDPDPRIAVRRAILELGQTGPYLRALMGRRANLISMCASDVKDMHDHARYYFPPERAYAFEYLRSGSDSYSLTDLRPTSECSLSECSRALMNAGVRVALVDLTPPDVAMTPVWVIRAVSPDLQPISFGYGLDRKPVARLASLGIRASKDEIAPIW